MAKNSKSKKIIAAFSCILLIITAMFSGCIKDTPSKSKYEKLYYEYINNVLTPQIGYCESQEETFKDIQESQLYFKMKDKKGVISAYVKDLNRDGVPEMITVSSLGKGSAENTEFFEDSIVVEIHCYSIEDNTVSDKGIVQQIAAFKNSDERICVYLLDGKTMRICIGSNYWPSNISSTSFSDQSFSSYIFTDNLTEEYHVVRYVSHGKSAYVINGTDYGLDEGNEKCAEIFLDMGLDDSFVNGLWNEFSTNNIEKICLCGTEHNNKNGYKAYVTDYTKLETHIEKSIDN